MLELINCKNNSTLEHFILKAFYLSIFLFSCLPELVHRRLEAVSLVGASVSTDELIHLTDSDEAETSQAHLKTSSRSRNDFY